MDPVRPIPPPLRPYVAALVAYDVDLGAPGVHVGMPGTTLTVVLPLDEPLDVGGAGRPASRGARWSTVSGLHTGPAAIVDLSDVCGAYVVYTPDMITERVEVRQGDILIIHTGYHHFGLGPALRQRTPLHGDASRT